MGIYDSGGVAHQGIRTQLNESTAFDGLNNGAAIRAKNTDDNYMVLQARDNGVGRVEIARMIGAADPYFSIAGVATPTNVEMPVGHTFIKYAGGGNATLYVNDGGVIKTLVLGAPA